MADALLRGSSVCSQKGQLIDSWWSIPKQHFWHIEQRQLRLPVRIATRAFKAAQNLPPWGSPSSWGPLGSFWVAPRLPTLSKLLPGASYALTASPETLNVHHPLQGRCPIITILTCCTITPMFAFSFCFGFFASFVVGIVPILFSTRKTIICINALFAPARKNKKPFRKFSIQIGHLLSSHRSKMILLEKKTNAFCIFRPHMSWGTEVQRNLGWERPSVDNISSGKLYHWQRLFATNSIFWGKYWPWRLWEPMNRI